MNPDLYVLTLPMAYNQSYLVLLAFIGGLSAGTSMVIMASIALSIMIRSEEHTSELQSLMRISYAVFCLKKKTQTQITPHSVLEPTIHESPQRNRHTIQSHHLPHN